MPEYNIDQISRMISEDIDEQLITVDGFGRMTKQQAINSTISFLRQMAEKLEEGANVPLHYFDMAKAHYQAAINNQVP